MFTMSCIKIPYTNQGSWKLFKKLCKRRKKKEKKIRKKAQEEQKYLLQHPLKRDVMYQLHPHTKLNRII